MKSRIVFIGILAAAITIIIYLFIFPKRIATIERDYVNSIEKISKDISRNYIKLTKKDDKKDPKVTARFLKKVNIKYKRIALLAIADKNKAIKLVSKNDKFIPTGKLYDLITDDFVRGKLTIPAYKSYIKNYYNTKTGNEVEQFKFYIFINKIKDKILLIVFPYDADIKIITKILLEVALIILFFIIASTLIYLKIRGPGKTKIIEKETKKVNKDVIKEEKKEDEIEKLNIEPIDEKMPEVQFEEVVYEDNDNQKNTATASASEKNENNLKIQQLFTRISSEYSLDLMAMYLKSTPNILSKSMEYRENAFSNITEPEKDIFDLNNDMGNELKNATSMILNNSKRILIPITYNKIFLGIIKIERTKSMNGPEINAIKSEINNNSQFVFRDDINQ
ncbi:hypothetical protein ACFL20_09590 [Spirochaetota bacterium]